MPPLDWTYWRGVEDLDSNAEIQTYLDAEFPDVARLPTSHVDRRRFLRLLGASLALAGVNLAGCRRWPVEEIRPHTSQPEGVYPGVPQFYATSFELDGVATGLLAKSYDGRPIKIEGNPDHPFSLGATNPLMQASIWELYDPERNRTLWQRVNLGPEDTAHRASRTVERTWMEFEQFALPHFRQMRAKRGAGLAILSQPQSSPTLARLKLELETALPQARWFTYQPLHRDHEYVGSRQAFGQTLRPQYALDQAHVIAAFDADLLGAHPAHLRWAREWSAGRHSVAQGRMNRMYVAESGLSITGGVADCRLAIRPSAIARCVSYIACRLGLLDSPPTDILPTEVTWLDILLADLVSARGASIVVAGPAQPPEVHWLTHAINDALGNIGHTIQFTAEPLAQGTTQLEDLRQLADWLQGSAVQTLVIVGGNPLYDAPADIELNLNSAPNRPLTTIHLSYYRNETSAQCTWSLPAAHFLECWGDGRAWDGTWTLQQPLILPLFQGRSPLELLALIQGSAAVGREMVRQTFDAQFASGDRGWERALHDGLVVGSAYPRITPPRVESIRGVSFQVATSDIEVRFVADYKVHDGRFANNAWMQELPDPLTKLTWDNAALLSIADASRLGIRQGDLIRIEHGPSQRSLEIAAMIVPGHAEGCLTLPLGYGRTEGGDIGAGVGFNVYSLRTMAHNYGMSASRISNTGKRYSLATTQLQHLYPSVADVALRHRLGEKGKPGYVVHEATLEEYLRDHHAPHGNAHVAHAAPLFDPPQPFDSPHQWGMTIDLNACIGCSGCVVACQAENNIPVVGKVQVANSREMHWLRIDRYFKGPVADPDVVFMPVTCAHCESAPCEQVCPVAATVHDTEGLNAMVYNRCIGTRYCANNCPLKVRRFNYLEYHANHPRRPARPWVGIPDQQQATDVSPLVQLMHNPEVTVRMRGVMEKCTYCVQRIVAARIDARNRHAQGDRETSLVAEGEVQTACQASCPTQAIRFGDLNDPQSAVALARRDDRHYEVLEELNLRSRTTHLAKIRNR